ncbi:CaiB/BaiF CoA transferase family protein [Rubritepida flocculans]|uniref:CaiB/BaiF CoA transferase family protein n=1 Tax=Rubritepida flocculans TaxID=182403 RepID=UPI000488423B|nr:CoA transferase [Rubritepida flocculans]
MKAGEGGPLAGVRVVDLTVNILGPVATQVLGDMGADIVKVEPPTGDPIRFMGPSRSPGMSVFFLNTNRNKRSVVLDLKRPEAMDALLHLVDGADVFVHNMRLGAAERLGLSYAALAKRNRRLVYAAATGFRQSSRWRDKPAFDDVIQGMSGIADLVARRDGKPGFVPMAIADKFCGFAFASAIGMALYRRERTGVGQEVHVPMLETMLSFNLVEHLWGATLDDPSLGVGYVRMLTPFRRPHATADGYICLLANTDEQWARLFVAIDRPELAQDARFARLEQRTLNIAALYEIVTDVMRTRTTAEWQRRLDAADIPNGPVLSLDSMLDDPYLNETGFFQRVEHPTEGRMITTTVATEFSESPGSIRRLAPRLGEHTAEVLREAGLPEATVAALTA